MDKRADRGKATREQLVAVATRLFAERGFEGASIEAVLDEAGVSRGSLYHHFANKEALFEAALDAVEARIGDARVGALTRALSDPTAEITVAAERALLAASASCARVTPSSTSGICCARWTSIRPARRAIPSRCRSTPMPWPMSLASCSLMPMCASPRSAIPPPMRSSRTRSPEPISRSPPAKTA